MIQLCQVPDLRKHLERATGIEPAFSAWEADVLPLNYTRVSGWTLAKDLPSRLITPPSMPAQPAADLGVTLA